MSSATSTSAEQRPETSSEGLQPWQFFVLTALGCATAVTFLSVLVELNVLLAVFNLIPVPPLDGGNVLAGLVPEPVARGIDMLRPYGMLILYALLLSGVFRTIVLPIQDIILRWLL